MRPFSRLTLLFLLLVVALPALAESPRSLYNKGKKAEAKQDYMAAFEAYRQAYEQKPTDLAYRIAFQRTRFLASSQHKDQGIKLRNEGKLVEALAEFEYAARIDPSNEVSFQEVRRTKAMIDGQANPGAATTPAPPANGMSKRAMEAAGPAELAPVSPQPITLEISNDSKMVYETIGKLAGINVLFDPDYVSKRVTLKLNGVALQESLDILAFYSNTFWRPVTANTIFVAANNQQKRKDLEQSVIRTFYLTNSVAPTDLQDVTNVLRQVADFQKMFAVPSQNALVVRGTPDQIALAEKLINDIDRAKPEVIVEVAVMQVRKDKLRTLGISPPTSASVTLTGPTTTTTTPTTGTGGTTTTPTTTNNLTINTLANLKDTDFAVSIPSATANFLFSDNNTKLIQNPQVRALDNQKASLKIGDRIPIATGSFGSGFGANSLAASGLVNTQFQYIDVGVNVDITPRVHADREVTLKLVLEVSSVTGNTTIGGISQPIISQRKIEHDIRLKEGEVNLLGGMFEQTDIKTVSGLPFLAQLPFLKYLFASEHTEKADSEIVFILVPHIVRGIDLTELNQRALDVGTSAGIDLRRVTPKPQPVSPAPQQPVTPQQQLQPTNPNPGATSVPPQGVQTQPSNPNTQAQTSPNEPVQNVNTQQQGTTTPNAAAQADRNVSGPSTLRVEGPQGLQAVGATFSVNVVASNASDWYSAPMQISFDPKVLEFVNISNGDLMSKDGQVVTLVHRVDAQRGIISANAQRPPNSSGAYGDGAVFTITFKAVGKGDAVVALMNPNIRTSKQQSVPVPAAPATVSVK